MKTKPFLSFWQIWNLTFGFLGIQFGFALQNANSSRILQVYGADVEQLSLFWLAAPITGMIIQHHHQHAGSYQYRGKDGTFRPRRKEQACVRHQHQGDGGQYGTDQEKGSPSP